MPDQVYHTHLRAGPTRSWGLHGLSETLSPKRLKRIIAEGLECSFWTVITRTLHTVSAPLRRSTTSLCCACLHTLLIAFSHVTWESLGPLILLGNQRSIKHPLSGYQSGKQIYLPTMLELVQRLSHQKPSAVHSGKRASTRLTEKPSKTMPSHRHSIPQHRPHSQSLLQFPISSYPALLQLHRKQHLRLRHHLELHRWQHQEQLLPQAPS